MISKAKIKWVAALKSKKNRATEGCFIAEGLKIILEWLKEGRECKLLLYTKIYSTYFYEYDFGVEVDEKLIETLSQQSTPSGVLAVFDIPTYALDDFYSLNKLLMLQGINDPGNMGTLFRSALWFGFDGIVYDNLSADVYQHKVVQSSMGAVLRIPHICTDLENFVKDIKINTQVIATTLDGNDKLPNIKGKVALMLGSESHGLSKTLIEMAEIKYSIPNCNPTMESLNVSIAGSIAMFELSKQ